MYTDGIQTNCLSWRNCILCDVCEEAMGKITEMDNKGESRSPSEGEDDESEDGHEAEGDERI
jgi:hypothetical protein